MDDRPVAAWGAVTIGARDPQRLAGFYAALLGAPFGTAGDDRPGWFRIWPGVAGGPVITFQPVGEAATDRAGAHLDLWVEDLHAACERVIALGGQRSREVQVFDRGRVLVMADVEGNEFCLLAGPAG